MRTKLLNYSLNNIDDLIKYLEDYRDSLDDKCDLFVRRLAEIGLPIIDEREAAAKGDGEQGYNKSYMKVEAVGKGVFVAKLIYEGTDVLFIEFGAGVHYNGNPDSSPHPKGVEMGYTIGNYSDKHKGLQDSWFYRDEAGSLERSFGTEATMPMYHASQEIIENIRKIAKQVFGGR